MESFGSLGFFKSFGSFDFLILVGILVALIVMVFSYIFSIKSFNKLPAKNKLMEEKVLPELISKYGKVISLDVSNFKRSISFERGETIFNLKVTPISIGDSYLELTENKIQFSVTNLREKFYIRQKSFFAPDNFEGCQSVQITMYDDFIFYSLHPQFLSNLMQNEKIRSEIYKYRKKVSRKFSVAFENEVMTIIWDRSRNDGEIAWDTAIYRETPQAEVQKLEQICQTAVVFYDELKKLEGESWKQKFMETIPSTG